MGIVNNTIQLDDKYYRWRCGSCREVHDDEDEARECCMPSILEGYACPICEEFHTEAVNAIECCGYDPDAPPPPPSAAELEAMGQQRLFL